MLLLKTQILENLTQFFDLFINYIDIKQTRREPSKNWHIKMHWYCVHESWAIFQQSNIAKKY